MTNGEQTTDPGRTADDHFVSHITRMCEHHESEAISLITLTIDPSWQDRYPTGDGTAEDVLRAARDYLHEQRAACIEQCGRMTWDEAGQ